jgi:2-desacetyl-2-hydroxyethyl bacteriochlorophyllide A dehydrogenase
MESSATWVKQFLNRAGTSVLARLGYSLPMIDETRREVASWTRSRSLALSRRVPLVTGRAVVWTAPGTAELLPLEIPAARRGEVTVEISTSVISPGTERAFFLQLPNTVKGYPFQPGYSAAGIVLSESAAGVGLTPGDRVAVANVGHVSVATAPAEDVYPIPDSMPLEAAALIQIGVICGQGVRRGAIREGEAVAVLGAGLIGAVAARLATAEGSGPVTVIARSRAKEASARSGGNFHFLSVDEDASDIDALGARVLIESTGDPAALAVAIAAAGEGARIVLLGSSRGVTRDLPTDVIREKRLSLVGAHVNALDFESRQSGTDARRDEALRFLEHVATGRLQVSDLVETTVDPREAGAFYRRLAVSRDVVGARYDWTLLPADERASAGRWLRLPDLAARGADMSRRPLPAPSGRAASDVMAAGERSGVQLCVGLLGCGDIALLNAAAIRAAPAVALVACFDPVEELAQEVAREYDADACSTSGELLERADVDAVLLAVPHHLHAPLGIEAAAAGKHVIVEKPLANDFESGRALVEAAEREGVVLSVCFPQRYEPASVEARRLIADGALGEVTGMTLRFLVDKPPSYWTGGFSGRAQTDWRRSRDRSGGGVLIMNLSHTLDLFRYLTRLEADVVAAHAQADDETSEIEDAISITVRYVNGAIGSILGGTAVRGSNSSELRIWGSDGHVAIEPNPLVYSLRALPGLRTGRWQALPSAEGTNSRALYFDRLAAAIRAGIPPDVTGQDGLAVQAFVEAAYRSALSGESVSVQGSEVSV